MKQMQVNVEKLTKDIKKEIKSSNEKLGQEIRESREEMKEELRTVNSKIEVIKSDTDKVMKDNEDTTARLKRMEDKI